MGSPAYFGKLVNFEASLRKPGFIPFGTFSPGDNLSFIADLPGTTETFQGTSTPPDGIRSTFLFTSLPVYVSWNGVQQWQGVGFNVTGPVLGLYTVQMRDYAGNILVPGPTDDIRAEISTVTSPPALRQPTKVAVPYAANLVIDTSLAEIITVFLTGNVASWQLTYGFSAIPDSTTVMIRMQQDAAGAHTVALPSNLVSDPGFGIDQGAGRTTVLMLIYNGPTGSWLFKADPFSVTGL